MNRFKKSLHPLLSILFVLLFALKVSSQHIVARGNCCGSPSGDGNEEDGDNGTDPRAEVCNSNGDDDRNQKPTSDGSSGIGMELETGIIRFQVNHKNIDCNEDAAYDLKGKAIEYQKKTDLDLHGTNWALTGDTTLEDVLIEGITAEFILDGSKIKLGTSDFKTAAGAVGDHIKKWNPHSNMDNNVYTVGDPNGPCNPIQVDQPDEANTKVDTIIFSPQITVPMPLEAIQELFRLSFTGSDGETVSELLSTEKSHRSGNMVYVNKNFFQAGPNGLSADNMKDEILGFLSLVVSYAKSNMQTEQNESLKSRTSIMPRNDFTSMYQSIDFPSMTGSLYDLVKVLVCYKNVAGGDDVKLDTEFCGNTVESPDTSKPGKIENQKYAPTDHNGKSDIQCTVKEWLDSIQQGAIPDLLSQADKTIDGSIGKYDKAKFENVYNTKRKVPLFEFRRIGRMTPDEMADRADKIQTDVLNLHQKYAGAARLMKRRIDNQYSHIRRDAPTNGCAMTIASSTKFSATPSTTPPPPMPSCYLQEEDPDHGVNARGCICGSTTLPILSVADAAGESALCAYTAMPTKTEANPISKETYTYTSNCQACTVVGGIADTPTCTLVGGCTPTAAPTPTIVVHLSNNSVPIGDENKNNNGSDLRQTMFTQLQGLCPTGGHCNTAKDIAVINHIPTVAGGDDKNPGDIYYEDLYFTINYSNYSSSDKRDQMLAAAVSNWQQAVAQTCATVKYQMPSDNGVIRDCSKNNPPVKRDLPAKSDIGKRLPSDPPEPVDDDPCIYDGTICAGPDYIDVELDPNTDFIGISVTMKLEKESAFNEFICELIVDGLSDLAMEVAPELVPAELIAEIDMQSICEGMANHRRF